ncbi:double-stranded RNA-binding protein 1-like [Senna tora]|uniref:Double-stranded RNA-binding protein 1-like n=1 Tax=Senna tora TaxID=362788 RepID=A0A834WRH6_9FABA|nr:double-stranded RNA-binding protein 1-like [Senna tora]
MYKTKLQELCHKRRWGLPKYSIMKDGPDHIPSFKASLSLNGLTFDSLEPSTSSKHAQNLAAKNELKILLYVCLGSSTPTAETDTKEQIIGAARPQDTPIPADSSVMMHDFDHLYKSRLQNYAQRRNLDLPIFTNKTEAEQAAAKVALISLSLDSFQKGDSGVYRNLLQELAQKEGFCTPTYKTIKSGTVHMPTFFSIVEVEGKEFPGKAGKSKKQAEQNAAKVAYITLKDRKLILLINGMPSQIDLSTLSISESNKAMTAETNSYLLCNRFRVYTSFPDISFPEGTTVLPIRENRWVAVSLEFPNEDI